MVVYLWANEPRLPAEVMATAAARKSRVIVALLARMDSEAPDYGCETAFGAGADNAWQVFADLK